MWNFVGWINKRANVWKRIWNLSAYLVGKCDLSTRLFRIQMRCTKFEPLEFEQFFIFKSFPSHRPKSHLPNFSRRIHLATDSTTFSPAKTGSINLIDPSNSIFAASKLIVSSERDKRSCYRQICSNNKFSRSARFGTSRFEVAVACPVVWEVTFVQLIGKRTKAFWAHQSVRLFGSISLNRFVWLASYAVDVNFCFGWRMKLSKWTSAMQNSNLCCSSNSLGFVFRFRFGFRFRLGLWDPNSLSHSHSNWDLRLEICHPKSESALKGREKFRVELKLKAGKGKRIRIRIWVGIRIVFTHDDESRWKRFHEKFCKLKSIAVLSLPLPHFVSISIWWTGNNDELKNRF